MKSWANRINDENVILFVTNWNKRNEKSQKMTYVLQKKFKRNRQEQFLTRILSFSLKNLWIDKAMYSYDENEKLLIIKEVIGNCSGPKVVRK